LYQAGQGFGRTKTIQRPDRGQNPRENTSSTKASFTFHECRREMPNVHQCAKVWPFSDTWQRNE
jgi:hypothetical protein